MGYKVYARDCDGYGEVMWLPTFDTYEEAEQRTLSLREDTEYGRIDIYEVDDNDRRI